MMYNSYIKCVGGTIMLIFEPRVIGNKLYIIRKKHGLTQAEVAELAELSLRAYADIERGKVSMRVETVLKICKVLNITPDDLLTEDNSDPDVFQHDIIKRLQEKSTKSKKTALKLVSVYLDSIE